MQKHALSLSGLFAATVGLLCSVAVPAAAQSSLDKIKADGVIQMGVALEPPYSVLNPDGTLTGADPDVLRAVFSELGAVELKANVVDWGALIPGLLANRFDAVATGLFIRAERCEAVLFSQPVLCSSEAFIVAEGNPKGIMTYADLVASDAMFSSVAGAEERRALDLGMPAERIMVVPDVSGAVDLLTSGRVDIIGFPDVTLIEVMKRLPEDQFDLLTAVEGEPIQCSAAAFSKNNTELRDFFDAGLIKLQESGKFAEILTAYGFDPEVTSKIDRTTLCGAEN